jgi:transcriptional regulator with XRE-family HTH domain
LADRLATNHPIARRLKQARLASGLSQKNLGIRAGIDPSVASQRVNQYETQRHRPAFEVVRKLAQALKLPAPYFYTVDDQLADLIVLYGQLAVSERAKAVSSFRKAVERSK